MKLADDVLIAIMDAVRRGLMEGTDISEDLRSLDLAYDGETTKLKLSKPLQDVWSEPKTEV